MTPSGSSSANEQPVRQAPLTGRIIGRWRLSGPIGAGTFGTVYRAEHTSSAEWRAAVKVLHAGWAAHHEFRQRFLREATLAASAAHENVIHVSDVGIDEDGLCFLVMELLEGRTLTAALADGGPFAPPRAIQLGIEIARGLRAVHARGIVHRDLKPDNIFLVPRELGPEQVKILDFGIARPPGGPGSGDLTQPGRLMGTFEFMAPEQWRGARDLDGRVDVYALGAILYLALTGQLPFTGRTVQEWVCAHLSQEVPDPTRFGVPARMARLIVRMLAKERAERPATMAEVVDALRVVQGVQSGAGNFSAGQLTGAMPPAHVLPAGCNAPTIAEFASRPPPPADPVAQPAPLVGATSHSRPTAILSGDRQATRDIEIPHRRAPHAVVLGVVLLVPAALAAAFHESSPTVEVPGGTPHALNAVEIARFVADGNRATATQDWDAALAAAKAALSLAADHPAATRLLASAEREIEQREIYRRFLEAAEATRHDVAVDLYRTIDPESWYREAGRAAFESARRAALRYHLARTRLRVAARRCPAARGHLERARLLDENATDWRELLGACDRGDPGDSGARSDRSGVVPAGNPEPDPPSGPAKSPASPALAAVGHSSDGAAGAPAPSSPPPDPGEALRIARGDYARGDYQSALQWANRGLVDPANAPLAWRIIGGASCYTGDRRTAIMAWNRLPVADRSFLRRACDASHVALDR